jgi:ribosomal protein L7Ae-like RNA K-turn-binding protein
VAADTSDNSIDKLLPLLLKRGVPHVVAFTRAELGIAVGHAPLSAVGVTQASLARQIAAIWESGVAERGSGGTGEAGNATGEAGND